MTKRKSTSKRTKALPLNKVCHLEDFDHPALKGVMQDMYPGAFEFVIDYDDDGNGVVTEDKYIPEGRRRRKLWETAMAVYALGQHNALRDDARLLGVGAGREWTGFYLTRHVGQVFMTDLYATVKKPWANAPLEMLVEPKAPFGGEWQPQRMVTQHMDGTALRYADGMFDGVFSSSAIEHFGKPEQIAAASAEMGRVLKPGGVLTLSTEFKIDGEGNGWANVVLFDADMLDELIVKPSGCELVSPFDASVSEATLATRMTLMMASAHAGEYDRPHIVLINKEQTFTSAFLTLVKPSE